MCALRRVLYFVSLIVFSSSAFAAKYTYETVRVGPGQYAPNGTATPITLKVKNTFHQIVPVANKRTLSKLAVKAIRGGGVGVAVSAAVAGLGYVIDQATGDLKKVEIKPGPPAGDFVSGINTTTCQNTWPGNHTYNNCMANCNSRQSCHVTTPTGELGIVSTYGWDCPSTHGFPAFQDGKMRCFSAASEPIEDYIDLDPADWERVDQELDQRLSIADKTAVLRNAIIDVSPSGVADIADYPVDLNDVTSGTQLRDFYETWPELKNLIEGLLNAEIANDKAAADPNFEPSHDEKIIINNGSASPPLSGWPSFCSWATFLCQPFVPDEHPEVPTLDLEVPEYDSELPQNASCPGPVVFQLAFFGRHEISLQPACDMAAAIRAPLIAISYLVAGFIVVGVRR